MLWIKRNLFLAVGGFLAVLLLGGGVYYFLNAQSRNNAIEEQLETNKSELNRLQGQVPFPSPANIEAAKKESEKLQGAVDQLHKFFSPVPAEKVTGVAFRAYRDNTLAELQAMAEESETSLPSPNYAFSFETQKPKTEFREGTFPAIPEQMAEVKALSRILFDANIDPLINLRRARVSKDDEESSANSDYHSLKVETNANAGTVSSPYEVTFGCLSSDISSLLSALAKSPHGFIVKTIHVEPAVETGTNQPSGRMNVGGAPQTRRTYVAPVADNRPVYLLKEKRLKATLLIYAIKKVK